MPKKEEFSKKIDDAFRKLKSEIMYFYDEDMVYGEDLTNWLLEIGIKNKIIHLFKNNPPKRDKEMVRRRRSEVYWVDFGVNIGSEFNYPHFCVVIKEFTYHAIVVPISSMKEEEKDWKSVDNLYMEIGPLKDLPEKQTDSYAVVSQIKSVSKQRLSSYKHKGKFIKMKLTDEQMDKIDQAILDLATKKTQNS
ncbi:type II toxin-antitoxin system PemK/MazF family toxin [Bacillus testis]|uniref:type II toxin-antitoxin system PemK/MazF family toxin n=1 Tax=Bacillus testis TaxID=1622072 RepID=UPI00067EEEF4|nr:type II toxin-antitoxin system PemK/MazF family toxin [Bacillus testis]